MALSGIRELLERSDSSGSRSTILKPLAWFLSIFISGIILLLKVNAPNWIIIFFIVPIGIAIIIFFFTFIFCLFKDRDALRSEKFSIQKMAIEKGVFGDNITGLLTEEKSKVSKEAQKLSNESETGE